MLDFKLLEYDFAEDRKGYSFVGIKRDSESEEKKLKLLLPLGIHPEDESYSTKKELFFLLYRTLRKYTGKLKQFEKNKKSKGDRDGVGEGAATNTFSIETDEGTEEVVYTRFSGLDDVLDGYDELRLFAMRERMRRSDKIDYSNIHRYLDKAVYLPDDTIFIDEVETPKPTLGRHTTDLVRMYCYIYSEIKREMDESNDISPEVAAEAENFQEEHLSPNDSLFDEESHTGDILRDQLERIDEQTAFKDDAYWHFYEAVEAVLYPQRRIENSDGTHWGISNFCFVWEDMCQEKLAADKDFDVLYADRIDGVVDKSQKTKLQPAFNLSASTSEKVSLKPDAIVKFPRMFAIENFEFHVHSFGPRSSNVKPYAAIQCLPILENEKSGEDVCWFCSKAPRLEGRNSKWEWESQSVPDLTLKRTDKPYKNFVHKNAYRPKTKAPFQDLQWTRDPRISDSLNLSMITDYDSLQHPTSWLCIMAMRCWDSKDEDVEKYFRIIDFKYKKSPSDHDLRKQLVYELALSKPFKAAVQNMLIMPGKKTKEAGTLRNDGTDDPYQGIWLVTWNARETLKSYIGEHQS